VQILGVKIDNLNLDEALEKIREFLSDDPLDQARRQHYIVLPYADFLVRAQQDREFRDILNRADLSLSDGIGPVIASCFFDERLKGRVTGVDLIESLFEKFGQRFSFFLFGAQEGVASQAAAKIEEQNPLVKINGTLNGFVGDGEALEKIKTAQPEILLVGLGSPKQEKWIAHNLVKLPTVKLAIGVGGAFNFLSGRIKRAPRIFRQWGLEWLWRLFREPWRWRQIFSSVVIFSYLVLKNKFFKKKLA